MNITSWKFLQYRHSFFEGTLLSVLYTDCMTSLRVGNLLKLEALNKKDGLVCDNRNNIAISFAPIIIKELNDLKEYFENKIWITYENYLFTIADFTYLKLII